MTYLQIGYIVVFALVIIAAVALASTIWSMHVAELNKAHYVGDPSKASMDDHEDESDFEKEIRLTLEAAGYAAMTPKLGAIISAGAGALALLVGIAFGLSPQLSLLIGVVGLFVPYLYVKAKANSATANFPQQLGDALPLIASSLRSGMTIQQALINYERIAQEPIKSELAHVRADYSYGKKLSQAIEGMSERMHSKDAKMLSTAIAVQEDKGGGLADIIENIAEVIKNRVKLRAHIRTLTAEERGGAKILAAIPFAGIVLFSVMSDMFREFYTQNPLGWGVIALCVVMCTIAMILMNKIADIEID